MTTALNSRLPAAPAHPARGAWVMLCLLLAGQFMGLLDVTIVNVALPTIGRSLHGSGAGLQLVVAGYTISYATLLITGARLGDIFGRRRMFLIGVLAFTAASLACGLAPTFAFLIAARLVQGAGAAAMIPQIMSVIQQRFEGQARARALGAYAAVLATGAVAGQVLGGVLVTANLLGTQWRPVFLVNVPVGLAIALAVPRVLPRDTPQAAGGRRRPSDNSKKRPATSGSEILGQARPGWAGHRCPGRVPHRDAADARPRRALAGLDLRQHGGRDRAGGGVRRRGTLGGEPRP